MYPPLPMGSERLMELLTCRYGIDYVLNTSLPQGAADKARTPIANTTLMRGPTDQAFANVAKTPCSAEPFFLFLVSNFGILGFVGRASGLWDIGRLQLMMARDGGQPGVPHTNGIIERCNQLVSRIRFTIVSSYGRCLSTSHHFLILPLQKVPMLQLLVCVCVWRHSHPPLPVFLFSLSTRLLQSCC